MPKSKQAHLIGICGVGMSGVALLLRQAGYTISGSDAGFYPPVSELLKRERMRVKTPYAANNIPPGVDLIVIGKHAKLTDDNPEVRAARRSVARVVSFPEVLRELSQDKHNLVVTGSYGKSTCAFLLSWMLTQTGKDPSYFVGAVPLGRLANAQLGGGAVFVLEGDEYPAAHWDDRAKFLFMHPKTLLLTAAAHDHKNIYPTLSSYLKPFTALVRQMPPDGLIVAADHGENLEAILKDACCQVVRYAADQSADWGADRISYADETRFDLIHKGTKVVTLVTSLFGSHNVENIVGSAATLLERGWVTSEELATHLKTFPGLHRRLERKSLIERPLLFEDMSSSAPKLKATLRAVRQRYPKRRIVAVFQPHAMTFRRRESLPDYEALFQDIDELILVNVPKEVAEDDDLRLAEIQGAAERGVCSISIAEDGKALPELVVERVQKNDIVLLLSSGGMEGAIEPSVRALEQKFGDLNT